MAGKVTRTAHERFWEKVDKSSDCWIWTANRNPKGYGRFWNGGRNHFAHRWSWMMSFGGFDEERLRVLHKCDQPSCVNPAHLFLGSLAENISDRDIKGRTARGERNGNTKLSIDQVLEIKSSSSSLKELAARFAIHPTQVHNIRTGKQWKHA